MGCAGKSYRSKPDDVTPKQSCLQDRPLPSTQEFRFQRVPTTLTDESGSPVCANNVVDAERLLSSPELGFSYVLGRR